MDNKIKTQSIQTSVEIKSYFCPHCKKLLMKGNVKSLSMACPNCQKLIDSDEEELLKSEISDKE